MTGIEAPPRPILFVDHAKALGGAERVLLSLAANFDHARWTPHLACPIGDLADQARRLGIVVHLTDLPRLRRSASFPSDLIATAGRLGRLARQTGACCIYANTVRAAVFAGLSLGTPKVWHMHDFWLSEHRPEREWADRWGKRWLVARSALVIAISAAVRDNLPPSPNVQVVYSGIDLSRFAGHRSGRRFRQRFDIPGEAPLVGMVGRLRPWKGQHTFLKMAARVAPHLPNAHFVIVGGTPFGVEDDYPARLHQMVRGLELESRITFTSQVEDVPEALAAMDLFVHPGDPEPFGLVNVEAMAMQLPVVAFAHGALPEIVQPGETGLLVRPPAVDEMAQAVIDLLANANRRLKMGVAGRKRVEAHFTDQQMAAEIDVLLRKALGA